MSVPGSEADSIIQPFHYGSKFEMADYTTNAHTFYLNAGYLATAKLRLHGLATFNISNAGYEEGIMPEAELYYQGVHVLEHQDFSFEDMHEYSDLDYEILRFSAGMEYEFTPRVSVTLDGDFARLVDYEGYLFGDQTGSFYMIRSGVWVNF